MKLNYLFLIVLFFAFSFLKAQPSDSIDWDLVIDRYVEKYQPEEIPAWIFPMIFENGVDERDTIYLGYDENGSSTMLDTQFAEKCYDIHPVNFETFISECSHPDSLSVYEINILNTSELTNQAFISIRLRKGLYPVTLYFNSDLFYSNSLPAHPSGDTSIPKVQVDVWLSEDHSRMGDFNEASGAWGFSCPWLLPVILTDTTYNFGQCAFVDSLDFGPKSNVSNIGITDFVMNFRFWEGTWTDVDLPPSSQIKVYPNPASDKLHLEINKSSSDGQILLINSNGQILKKIKYQSNENSISIPLVGFLNGIYFIQVINESANYTSKFIIQK